MLWSAGDGDRILDGGVGEDTFVLRGSDGPEEVVVAPSNDGTQIVLTINGTETVTLDGTDLFFIMGNGNNSVEITSDLSGTDLSPSARTFSF